VQLTEDFCYLLHENGQISQYTIESRDLRKLNTSFDKTSEQLTQISSRYQALYGVTSTNSIYQLVPDFKMITNFPKHQKVRKLCSGLEHTMALTTNGEVYSFGCGLRGQLGHGDVSSQDTPKLIEAINGIKIVDIACGAFHSCAVSSFGDLYTFGWNSCGQLGMKKAGDGAQRYQQVFTLPQIIDLEDETDAVKNVYCGHKHTLIRTERNRLFSTGSNKFGQLGVGDTVDRDCFVEIPINGIDNESQISCGYWTTYLISNCQK
jgi:alpha-tubulin suppressor-like RCC1 family protein